MKHTRIHRTVCVTVLALGLIAGGIAGLWWYRTPDSASNAPAATQVLREMSRPVGHSPTDQAIATWTARVKHNNRDDTAWVNLGNALMQKARETADASYYSRAEAVFQHALGLNPHNVSALVGMAWVSGARHEFEGSIEWANRALALDAQHQDAYGLLGDAAVEMGDYETAFEHYQKMLDLRPDLASYSRAAHLLFLTGDVRKATWLMQKAIAAGAPYAENTAWCRAQLALMQWHSGALLAAEQGLRTALQQTPENYHLFVAMGKVLASKKDYQGGIDFYNKALAIMPQHEVIVALGDLYRLTDQPEEAEKQYALVEAMHQLNRANGVRNDIRMARFYADHDRNLSAALQEAETVYQTRKNVFVADTLAWAYYKNGRYQEARKIINKALSQRTPDAHILFHAGMIYAKLGDRPAAQKYLYQALSLNPHFHPLYATVAADTLQQLGAR